MSGSELIACSPACLCLWFCTDPLPVAHPIGIQLAACRSSCDRPFEFRRTHIPGCVFLSLSEALGTQPKQHSIQCSISASIALSRVFEFRCCRPQVLCRWLAIETFARVSIGPAGEANPSEPRQKPLQDQSAPSQTSLKVCAPDGCECPKSQKHAETQLVVRSQ